MIETDVVVVGAGPSGSFSALTAAKLGAKVTVFEEHPSVGIPNHCAGHVSVKSLERLGFKLPFSLIENQFRSAVFFSPAGKQFSVRFPSLVTCVINRGLFDKFLANIAISRGAQYLLNARAKSLILEHNAAKGVVVQKLGKAEKISSHIIIDAEGITSALLKSRGLKSFNRKMLIKAVSAEVDCVENVEDDCVEVYLGKRFADGLYAWVIPKNDGTAKVGLATKSGNPKQCLENFMYSHKIASVKLRKSKITHLSYHAIPLGGPIPRTYADGFLAVGDAASQVKPTTGGGVVMGLTCAKIAGEVAARAMKEGDFSESFLKRYEEQWKQRIGFDMKMMLFVRKLLNRLSDNEVDKLFDVATRLRLNETLVGVSDVDFQGKEMIRLAKSPSSIAALVFFFFSALT